jgi:hypothetical protein
VRGPLHEAGLGRDPAEREADLIDKANAAHAGDGTWPDPLSTATPQVSHGIKISCRRVPLATPVPRAQTGASGPELASHSASMTPSRGP